jgi:hypothetical protein
MAYDIGSPNKKRKSNDDDSAIPQPVCTLLKAPQGTLQAAETATGELASDEHIEATWLA